MVEEGAGGDGLDGFAEAHFIGEQGALAEREVEHSLALVGVERVEGDVLRVAAGDDSGLVIAAEGDAFGGALAGLEEGLYVLGDADFGAAAEFRKGFGGVCEEGAVFGKMFTEGRAEFVEVTLDAEAFSGGDEVDAGRARFFGGAEFAFESAFQEDECGLGVFAGAEAIAAEVRASAGKGAVR